MNILPSASNNLVVPPDATAAAAPNALPPDTPEARQRERIPTDIHPDADGAVRVVAREIAALVRARPAAARPTVLGLATGSTPVRLYRELIRIHREERLSFRNVITFNLDEYYGIPRAHPQSYWRFMREQFFDHLDIPDTAIHVPDGTIPRHELFDWCADYERQIRDAGGLDLQILGIGRTGHVGFNEPGSTRASRTRLVTLDSLTRADAARDFLGEAGVPRHAITMGVGTILDARRIRLLAWGRAKAPVLARAVEEPPADALPASLLQGHPDCRFLVDAAAAAELTRARRPWLVTAPRWTPPLARRAVADLSREIKKPILKLLDGDYNEHGLADLLTAAHTAYDLNIRIFNEIQHTITGWPGGKPDADDSHRPERATPHPKRVLILSPEPMDAVHGMGGTIRRLAEQGHQVHAVQMTSGNLAVPDDDATLAASLVLEFSGDGNDAAAAANAVAAAAAADSDANSAATADFTANPASAARSTGEPPVPLFAAAAHAAADHAAALTRELETKPPFAPDTPAVRRLKAIIRRGESRASLRACALPPPAIRFLDLPFYENGLYRRFAPTDADTARLVRLLRQLRPHQIFITGRDDDPSSVPALCYEILRRALAQTRGEDWRPACRLWHYQSPCHAPAEPALTDMAVPLSPGQLREKTHAILHHRSQRSQTPGEGEAWSQSESAGRAHAHALDSLGLADYEAIEPFTRLHELEA